MSTWDLMQSGQYAKAVEAYSELLKSTVTPPNLFNRALAYLNLDDFQRALQDLQEADRVYREDPYNKRNGHLSDGHRIMIGVVHWVSGKRQDALIVWQSLLGDHETGAITYTDAAGGVEAPCLAWFAGTVLGDSELVSRAEKFLKKRLRTKQAAAWPGIVGQFILARVSPEELMQVAASSGTLVSRHSCQANFWIGVRNACSGNEAKALEMYRAASESNALLDEEFYLARHEWRKFAPPPSR